MTTPSVSPRLIRPSKDGQEGDWSYLLQANGHDYIFPALVNELGQLKGMFDKDEPERKESLDPAAPDVLVKKVIYWKASEWETKLLPHAVAWMDAHKFEWPDIPYPFVELRKIEDRDGDERVSEVVVLAAVEATEEKPGPALMVYQFQEVEGQESKGRRPLMQWWMEGFIEFKDGDPVSSLFSVPRACEKLGDWGRRPEWMQKLMEQDGAGQMFRLIALHDSKDNKIREEALRVIVLWVAFCRYISSLKTTYEDGLPTRGPKRSAVRTTEEALALEQATIFKTVGILKSGCQRKPVATGTGTKHRYRYLVRGHERIINGKSIWIKPQIRGEGEFLNRATGTEVAKEAADAIEPPAAVTIKVEAGQGETAMPHEEPAAQVMQEIAAEPEQKAMPPALPTEPVPQLPARRPSLVRATLRLILSFFRFPSRP